MFDGRVPGVGSIYQTRLSKSGHFRLGPLFGAGQIDNQRRLRTACTVGPQGAQ